MSEAELVLRDHLIAAQVDLFRHLVSNSVGAALPEIGSLHIGVQAVVLFALALIVEVVAAVYVDILALNSVAAAREFHALYLAAAAVEHRHLHGHYDVIAYRVGVEADIGVLVLAERVVQLLGSVELDEPVNRDKSDRALYTVQLFISLHVDVGKCTARELVLALAVKDDNGLVGFDVHKQHCRDDVSLSRKTSVVEELAYVELLKTVSILCRLLLRMEHTLALGHVARHARRERIADDELVDDCSHDVENAQYHEHYNCPYDASFHCVFPFLSLIMCLSELLEAVYVLVIDLRYAVLVVVTHAAVEVHCRYRRGYLYPLRTQEKLVLLESFDYAASDSPALILGQDKYREQAALVGLAPVRTYRSAADDAALVLHNVEVRPARALKNVHRLLALDDFLHQLRGIVLHVRYPYGPDYQRGDGFCVVLAESAYLHCITPLGCRELPRC